MKNIIFKKSENNENIYLINNNNSNKTIKNQNEMNDKNRTYKQKYIAKNIRNFLLFLFAYLLYFLSLEKCYDGMDECCMKQKWIKMKLIEEIISCIIISIMFILMFYEKISKFHIFHFIFVFLFFYNYSHGFDFEDHGYFNFIGYFVILLLIILLLLFFRLICICIKKSKYFSLGLLILFMILKNNLSKINIINCNDWSKGLNNTFIENNINKYGCQINFPKYCPYKIFKHFLDFTKIKGINCKDQKNNNKEILLKLSKSPYINNNTYRFGVPLTNKDYICFLDFKDNSIIRNYYLDNLIDIDNKTLMNKIIKNKKPEVIIDFNKSVYGEININLIYNETLSKTRRQLEKKTNPYSRNILILYIDSVSRANSIRKLKKTVGFFEKFISYKGGFNNNYPKDYFHSFQFFKYHSFIGYTRENFPRIFYGSPTKNVNIVLITKYLKENGYITSYSGTNCQKDHARTFHNLTFEEAYDHQFLLCDPNKQHMNINTIKCLYGNIESHYLYEYSSQFWRKYNNNRKFCTIVTDDGHEGTLESLKYVDNIIYNFLNQLFGDNLLKDSSIFLVSDHGASMPSIYYPYNFYKFEAELPMLYLIINDRKNITYNEQYIHLYKNQQTFITAYDIYNTIGNLIFGDNYLNIKNKTKSIDTPKTEYGISLFSEINAKIRKPIFYDKMYDYVCI